MHVCVNLPFADESGSRTVSAYLPKRPKENTTFIFCADGQSLPYFVDLMKEDMVAGHVGLVGVDSSSAHRGQEYVAGRDEALFRTHTDFFVGAVRDWVEATAGVRLIPGKSVVFGYSCGGSFAVSMAMQYPDLFGSAIALSVAGRPVRVDKPLSEPIDLTRSLFYLGAGESEPGGMKKYMKRLAGWIRNHGGHSDYRLSPGGHEIAVWRAELLRGWTWIQQQSETGG